MAKVYNFTMIIVGVIALAKAIGIVLPSTLLFNAIGIGSNNILGFAIWVTLLSTFLALGAGGLIATFFGRSVPESVVRAGVAFTLIGITIPDLNGITTWAASFGMDWLTWLTYLIIDPLIAGYLIAIVQWYGGQDI